MPRHQVPQFIEIEDKIFGPLTFKQFVYLVGSGGFAFIAFRLLPNFIAIVIATPVVILGLALAFYKINNKPFIFTLEAAFRYILSGKLYIWKKGQKQQKAGSEKKEVVEKIRVPKLSNSRLNDLTWGLDIRENLDNQNYGNQ